MTFLQFSLRSRAVGPDTLSAAGRRQLVSFVPANGPRGRLVQRAALAVLRVGVRAPLRRIDAWPLPMSERDWDAVAEVVRAAVEETGPFVWHLSPAGQSNRKFSAMGLSELSGLPTSYLRVTERAIAPMSPTKACGDRTGVLFPRRLSSWKQGDWSIERASVAVVGRHRAVKLDMPTLLALVHDVRDALIAFHPRGTPDHWLPAHGDLTFWNIRRDQLGRTALIDWEAACLAPPHTDLVRYVSTAPNGAELVEAIPIGVRGELSEAIDHCERLIRSPDGEPSWARRTIEAHRRTLGSMRKL